MLTLGLTLTYLARVALAACRAARALLGSVWSVWRMGRGVEGRIDNEDKMRGGL